MRISRTMIFVTLAAAAAIACTQTPAQNYDPNQQQDGTEAPAASATVPGKSTPKASSKPVNNTCIGKAGFTFDDGKTCDTCMSEQDGCCQKLIACFKDDPQCAALQKCVDDCSGTGGGGGTTGGSPGQTYFVNTLYASINASCGLPCHANGTGGAPILFKATALDTYTEFKNQGFQTSRDFIDKPANHPGPALDTNQKTMFQMWMTLEAGGTGTGGGGGTGTGGGGGGGGGDAGTTADGGLTGRACKDACKTTYAAAMPKWSAYQTCITTTCATQCQK